LSFDDKVLHGGSELLTRKQDWLYEEGEDTTKAVYTAKIEELRAVAGPIIQRYNDKLEEERQARLAKEEEEAAKRRAVLEAKRKAEEEAKKAAEPKDTEMADADGPEVEDPE
jgi:heat shock protein 4